MTNNTPADWRESLVTALVAKSAVEPTTTAQPESKSNNTDGAGDANRKKPSQADMLVELSAGAALFHTPGTEGEAYATIEKDGHRENWRVSSKGFRRWLSHSFYLEHKKAPGGQAIQDAMNVIAGRAIHDAPEFDVHVRVSEYRDSIYLDLADDDWFAVQITAEGWRIVTSDEVPVKFIRRRGMKALPVPELGGDLLELRPFVNVTDDSVWILVASFLVTSLRPGRPFPLLNVNGEQGSAKSTLCKMIREIVDPNQAPLRRPPRDERDLMIAATNGWLVAFDNLSGLSPSLSDCLCVLATGGGFGTRELYSDDEEKLFDAMRPVIINGIDDLATRPDLLDRSINITLEQISEENRRDEDELWSGFYQARPRILGGLLDAVAAGLANLPTVKLDRTPRMADFARLAFAASPRLGWTGNDFLDAYCGNRASANDLAIESSPVGPAILGLMHSRDDWQGTAKELLTELEDHHSDEKTIRRRDWPKSPKSMANALRRISPNLRASDVNVVFCPPQGKNNRRTIRLEWVGKQRIARIAQVAKPADSLETAILGDTSAIHATHGETQRLATDDPKISDIEPESGVAIHATHTTRQDTTQSGRQRVTL